MTQATTTERVSTDNLVFEQYYEHDYPSIYRQEAATPGALVVNDPSGPYNYFNPWRRLSESRRQLLSDALNRTFR